MTLVLDDQASELRAAVSRHAAGERASPARDEVVSTRHLFPRTFAAPRRRYKVVAIAGGKGGVGKTNLAVNLALCLGRLGTRTLLIDVDAGTANADLLLDVEPRHALTDFLSGRCDADALCRPIGPRVSFAAGVSGPDARSEQVLAVPRLFAASLDQLAAGADLVLLDCGAGVGPTVRGPALCADRVLVVATPEPTAITDAYALMKVLHQRRSRFASSDRSSFAESFGIRPTVDIGLIVNQVVRSRDAKLAADRITAVAKRFLGVVVDVVGTVRFDRHVPAAVTRRTPVVTAYPRCRAARDITALAQRLAVLV
ncbi:MAG: AAA family ATPase [Phycisphaerae bacterium]